MHPGNPGSGISIVVSHLLSAFDGETVTLSCAFTGIEQQHRAATLVPVTSREPNEDLYLNLLSRLHPEHDIPKTLSRIGDCVAPGPIAQAIFSGHRYARELGTDKITPLRDGIPSIR